MDNREVRAAVDALDWQLMWATVAGIGLVCWRVLSATLILASEDGSLLLASAVLLEAVVCGALVVAMRRNRLAAAVALVIIWAVGFFYAWYASGQIVPPFALISILIGVGLVQGIRSIVGRRTMALVESNDVKGQGHR